ncbi:MAG: (2Fe-2S)-binding protein [Candidatus Poribacteria bacterium]|nr:(2Fe-2S)-binding protein [Candidatus Poribacteria bacterium]
MPTNITLTVNSSKQTVTTHPDRPLLDVLRETLGLTGAKYGCGEGACGACTVLVDGRPLHSCITPISQAEGKSVTTIEGLGQGDALHPVQQAFLDVEAMQCGYCVPGMILSAVALLNRTPKPSREQIVAQMNGNICRCCGYPKIVEAIERVAGSNAEVSAR